LVIALDADGAMVSTALAYLSLGLDQSANPLFLLSIELQLLHANTAGLNLLRGKVLRLKEQRLITGRGAENAAMQAAFHAASDTPVLVRLCDREGRGVMILSIQRLQPAADLSVLIARAIDLHAAPHIDSADISRLFGLSPAESRVAARLLAGNDPSAIAESLKVSAETVRTHLKQTMIKTATHSQAQLIGVLLKGMQAVIPT
jgi:DNA-binding CsgD family transcriptional regulator